MRVSSGNRTVSFTIELFKRKLRLSRSHPPPKPTTSTPAPYLRAFRCGARTGRSASSKIEGDRESPHKVHDGKLGALSPDRIAHFFTGSDGATNVSNPRFNLLVLKLEVGKRVHCVYLAGKNACEESSTPGGLRMGKELSILHSSLLCFLRHEIEYYRRRRKH
jgi:hypothetical protein